MNKGLVISVLTLLLLAAGEARVRSAGEKSIDIME